MCYAFLVIIELFEPKNAARAWPCRAVLTDLAALFRRHTPRLSAETLPPCRQIRFYQENNKKKAINNTYHKFRPMNTSLFFRKS